MRGKMQKLEGIELSRLYVWLETDMTRTTKTARANQSVKVEINYGSKGNSKRLLVVRVHYPKNSEVPEVYIQNFKEQRKWENAQRRKK